MVLNHPLKLGVCGVCRFKHIQVATEHWCFVEPESLFESVIWWWPLGPRMLSRDMVKFLRLSPGVNMGTIYSVVCLNI